MVFSNTFSNTKARSEWAELVFSISCTFLMFVIMPLMGCPSDTVSSQTTDCSFDDDCALGTVCLRAEGVCGTAACEFCLAGQICYTLDDGTQSCSKPECRSASECNSPESCVDGVCTKVTCTSRDDCPDDKICNLVGACVEPPEVCQSNEECPSGEICLASGVCRSGCLADDECDVDKYCDISSSSCQLGCRTASNCLAGEMCVNHKCRAEQITSCAQVMCSPEQKCVPQTFECVDVCTSAQGMPNSCPEGQVCSATTGECSVNACVGKDPEQCQGDAEHPYWNDTFCACVACIDSTHCSGAGESCNGNGECTVCQTLCDSSTPNTCQGATPYCISGCCSECIGTVDCPSGEVCLEGFCGVPPDCSTDPSICPSGLVCEGGMCRPAASGTSCNPQVPGSCPFGQMCTPDQSGMSGMCSSANIGGGLGCGFCNDDCTCDGGLTCEGFVCTGCKGLFGSGVGLDSNCPSGQGGAGLCAAGICIPL